MIKEYKAEISIALFLVVSAIAFYFLYGLLLPFLFGLWLAFASLGSIKKIKKIVRNQTVATTLFLLSGVVLIVTLSLFLTQHINRDFNRLNKSFAILTSDLNFDSDQAAGTVKSFIDRFYSTDELESIIHTKSDSIVTGLKQFDYSQLDTESIKSSFEQIMSVFKNSADSDAKSKSRFSWFFIFTSSLFYFVLILYQIDYFIALRKKYFGKAIKSKVNLLLDDFNNSFVKYFSLRTKIVLLLSIIYIITFAVLDIPGLILMVFLITVLSYIPYLQYVVLIPLSIGCLTLSVESQHSFLFFFSIVLGAFILASIVEELVLTPRIMEKNIGINPVILVLALSVWSYVLGLPGILIGIPLTSLSIIYIKRFVLPAYAEWIRKDNTV
jgi:predicted PurR-regulated permease PerM